jgi:hypothetical protein
MQVFLVVTLEWKLTYIACMTHEMFIFLGRANIK